MTKTFAIAAAAVAVTFASLATTTTSADARPNISSTKIMTSDLGSGR